MPNILDKKIPLTNGREKKVYNKGFLRINIKKYIYIQDDTKLLLNYKWQ